MRRNIRSWRRIEYCLGLLAQPPYLPCGGTLHIFQTVQKNPPVTKALICHPNTPTGAVHAIEATVRRRARAVELDFRVQGELAKLRVPQPRTPRRIDGLWRHTCFEAFVAADDEPAYLEFNLAPSREWAVYGFESYRKLAPLNGEESIPRINVRYSATVMTLDAVIHVDSLTLVDLDKPLRFGLCAVIEEEAGALSYWALRHPPGKPDFHHRDAFALELGFGSETSENSTTPPPRVAHPQGGGE